MPDALKLAFGPFAAPARGVLVVFCDDALKFGPATARALGAAAEQVARAAKAERFTGKSGSALDLSVPGGLKVARLVVIGAGKPAELQPQISSSSAALAMGKLPVSASEATVFAELPGAAMRRRRPRRRSRRKASSCAPTPSTATRPSARTTRSRRQAAGHDRGRRRCGRARRLCRARGGRRGRVLARDLVNEPANVLYPEEFARRTRRLKKLGVKVEVLDVPRDEEARHERAARRRPGLRARSRVVVMRWNGGRRRTTRRSPSSARACASTPAASRSSRPPAWRT